MNCRSCGALAGHVFDLHTSRHGIDVPVYHCADCRAYWSDGGPVDYDAVDLTGYYLAHAGPIRARFERLFAHLETLKRPGRFIDIGAGIGFSVEIAQARGWQARGLEPNRFLAEHARMRGLDVAADYLNEGTEGRYDLVLIDNVLEHIAQPLPFLRHAARLLADDALLVVAVPPLDWLRDALGRLAPVRDHVSRPQINVFTEADEHVNMLGRRAMGRLAQAAGLEPLRRRFHPSPIYNNPLYRALGLDDGYYHLVRA